MNELSDTQTRFLTAFKECGTLRKAAVAAKVGRSTVAKWRADNTNGFRAHFEDALDDFADDLEAQMFTMLKDMKVGHNPTLMIFALKALRPLKYRELTQIPDDHARELLRKLEMLNAVPSVVADKPLSPLTALEQVQQILKGDTTQP